MIFYLFAIPSNISVYLLDSILLQFQVNINSLFANCLNGEWVSLPQLLFFRKQRAETNDSSMTRHFESETRHTENMQVQKTFAIMILLRNRKLQGVRKYLSRLLAIVGYPVNGLLIHDQLPSSLCTETICLLIEKLFEKHCKGEPIRMIIHYLVCYPPSSTFCLFFGYLWKYFYFAQENNSNFD